jgi:hypothetical protein
MKKKLDFLTVVLHCYAIAASAGLHPRGAGSEGDRKAAQPVRVTYQLR